MRNIHRVLKSLGVSAVLTMWYLLSSFPPVKFHFHCHGLALRSSPMDLALRFRKSSSQSISSRRTRLYSSSATKKWYFADIDQRGDLDKRRQNQPLRRIVFLGSPDVAATTLQTIYQASLDSRKSNHMPPFEISAVVTQPPKRGKRSIEPTPVENLARSLQLPVWTPHSARDEAFLDDFANVMRPDLCITAAYGQYLPKRFLATPKFGTVNIHPSLLPKYRGAAPVQRSLQAGDSIVGVTLLFTVTKMDAGPIIRQQSEYVTEQDTAVTVLPWLFRVGTDLLLQALPDVLLGKTTVDNATPQDESQATFAPIIDSAQEGQLLFWQESATACHNKFRGFRIWPGVFLYIQIGEDEEGGTKPLVLKIKVSDCRVVPGLRVEPTNVIQMGQHYHNNNNYESNNQAPSSRDNTVTSHPVGLYVVCYDGSVLELITIQPATKRPFPARDLRNGYPQKTFRWIPTPDDYNDNPQKYNARQRATKTTGN